MKQPVNPTPESFDQVADFCERHLEATRGREIGMTFGAAIQALSRLADHPGDDDDPEWRRLNDWAEGLLLEFSKRFIVAYVWVGDDRVKPVEPMSMRTNMIYDPGKPSELKWDGRARKVVPLVWPITSVMISGGSVGTSCGTAWRG